MLVATKLSKDLTRTIKNPLIEKNIIDRSEKIAYTCELCNTLNNKGSTSNVEGKNQVKK